MKAIIVRLEADELEVLRALADMDRRSVNMEVRVLVEEEAKRRNLPVPEEATA